MTQQIKKLLVNTQQLFTEVEKAQGRANLGCAAATDVPTDAVKYTYQTLSNIEKAQARQNINAATGDVVTTSSDGLMSASDKSKLDGIASGAEVNVQSDWSQTNSSADDYIKNKPSNLVQDASYVHTDNNFTTAEKNKLSGIAAGAEKNVQSDWNQNDTSADDYIKNKPTAKVVYVGLSDSYATVLGHVNDGKEVILRVWPTVDNPLYQDFRLMQYNPDGSMEFSCVVSDYNSIFTYKYMLYSNGTWQRTNTSATSYQGILIEGIGRNLHLNQNNYVQTNLPGGLFDPPASSGNSFERIDGANFAGAYKLACRHNVNDTYEIGISYIASGASSTYWFIGTETIIATDNTVTTKQAVYNDTVYYNPSTRFGGAQSTAFNPTIHKAIIYDGIGLIGPCSDCKIVIWNANDTIKIAFTSIEVGKVGATN